MPKNDAHCYYHGVRILSVAVRLGLGRDCRLLASVVQEFQGECPVIYSVLPGLKGRA